MRTISATLFSFAAATAACGGGPDSGGEPGDSAGVATTTEAPAASTTSEASVTTSPPASTAPATSDAASFDTIGNTPHLYFTRINDPVTLDFDLVRVPLEISVVGG